MAKTVLLVDDSSTVMLMHRMMLKESGYRLVSAKNGREAIERALAERPDAIVMDVVMPEMSGLEACQALRAREETRTVPILLVTTRGEPQNVEAGYAAGCTDYVTKPFDTIEVTAKLKSLLGE